MPGLWELLPEDTDEPERLELLDAAIPASLHASVTPVRPTCAHSRSAAAAAAVHPFPPLPSALYRPHQCRELFHASSEAPSRRLSESAGRSSLDGRSAARAAACGDGSCLRLRLKIIEQNRGMHNGGLILRCTPGRGSIRVYICVMQSSSMDSMCRCEDWDKHTVTPQRRRAFLK